MVPETFERDDQENLACDGDSCGCEEAGPWVRIVLPDDGTAVPNPVTFVFEASPTIVSVWFEANQWPIQDGLIPAGQGIFTHLFGPVNIEQSITMLGMDARGLETARDEVRFKPIDDICPLSDDVPGFNHYTIAAVNDAGRYGRDGTYPYCWPGRGDACRGAWGMIHDASYLGTTLFPGGADCHCSGHTLEIFLHAFRLWQIEHGLPENLPFMTDPGILMPEDVDLGPFYQHWQGFGVASEASSAEALEFSCIGAAIWPEDWDGVLPGDYINLGRANGSGHAAIFVAWVVSQSGQIIGLRYYSCNGSGDRCPDPADAANAGGLSGPSFKTEYFEGHGGTVIPGLLTVGRVAMPTGSTTHPLALAHDPCQ
jgi:hypothetical protein